MYSGIPAGASPDRRGLDSLLDSDVYFTLVVMAPGARASCVQQGHERMSIHLANWLARRCIWSTFWD